ncbi:LacI family DNA-binding transcriptional regulator [Cellulomonas dongxiuzhuiae]|uniref:LacI family transcriptional regulator n=1 Tax=Cellulomonas dongxiuzhuiae TaxID=2819979 RepID=A0ABX8GKI5_9CELL|nr:LacI family DNA-binding transcriptional regulator [Cellulomonas dongxiuzhuiae]MBO3095168.1 LacI family DNA-binding transcriptional regulator [Cellulomonas dongxiuzhuiae]QWC16171.1 LacI family transcriptional regulator [Cellulomonas dongxiuzhuiae]
MRATIRDVAREAGVHHTTVSRALNPATAQLVKGETAARIRAAAARLGYVPDALARGLKNNTSMTIGVVVPDLATPIMGQVVRGVEDVVMPRYVALVVNTDDDPERERLQLEVLATRKVDGLVVASARLHTPQIEALVDSGLPVVLANRRARGAGISSVTSDDAAGVAAAVEHLVALGHRRIAHISGPLDTSTGAARAAAFRTALTEHGIEPDDRLVRTAKAFRVGEGERAFAELVESGEQFTAVFAGNDLIAVGCYDAMRRRGISCPEHVSIVGFNDMPFVDKLWPPLTSVRVPHHEIGRQAAHMLLAQIDGRAEAGSTLLLPVSLQVRESTGPVERVAP